MTYKVKVTVQYLSGRTDVYKGVRHVSTEPVQWRLDTDDSLILIPMAGVSSMRLHVPLPAYVDSCQTRGPHTHSPE